MALGANPRGRASRIPELITSRENQWLKQFRAVLAGEKRRKLDGFDGEIIGVEGPHLVEAALAAGIEIVAILASETGARQLPAVSPSTRLLVTTDRLFAHVAGTEAPQGLAAMVKPRVASFDDLARGLPLILVMAGVQDPGNVGTLLRAAEAFGASGAATSASGGIGTADPWGPKALRASAGSALRLAILRGVAAPVLLAQLRVAGVRVYATAPGISGDEKMPKAMRPWEVNWREPAALLVGNEGAGLAAELLRSSDAVVRIPQRLGQVDGGAVESLNASVAGSILLYEAAKQRGGG